MKTKNNLFVVLFLILANITVAAQSGDVVLWIPVTTGVTKKDAQIPRNKQYVSVKLHSAYAYYKSGFFENIKQLLVKSDISLEQGGRRVEGTMLNTSRELPSKNGEFIGLNDHIAVLTPSSPTSLTLRVGFRGVGEDRFKKIFDVLSGPALKTPLNLADATIGKINGITSIVQSFLATPYTSDNPKSILDISQSFVLYSDDAEHPDALREGYLVVVSSREKKGGDLAKILSLPPDKIRISPQGQQLEYMEGTLWKPVGDNSYVIFIITKTTTRGEDESPWLVKYRAAEEASRKVLEGTPVNKAKADALALWREGNILIAADQNYIESEREGIRAAHLAEIKKILGGGGVVVNLVGPGIPANFAAVAAKYKNELVANASSISVLVKDINDATVPNADVVLSDPNNPAEKIKMQTDSTGRFTLSGVQAGEYLIETKATGSKNVTTQKIVVDAKDVTNFVVRIKP